MPRKGQNARKARAELHPGHCILFGVTLPEDGPTGRIFREIAQASARPRYSTD